MPPAIANAIQGDTAFLAADDPVKNGYGAISVASNVELTAAAATPQYLRTAASDLNVSAAKGLSLTASAGPLALSSTAQAVTVGGTSATVTTSGKQAFNAGGAFEVQAAASSFLKTSAGDMDVAATGPAGRLYATGVGAVTVGSSADSLYLSAITVGQSAKVNAAKFEVAAAAGGVLVSTTGELRLASSAGDSFITAMAGGATVLARDSVVVASNTGDTTIAAYNAGKSVKVLANSVMIGDSAASTTTVVGNLVVQGATTSVSTTNTTVKDNLISLNAAPVAAGRSPDLLFERHPTDHANVVGDTRTAFVYDEAADQFKLGYTNSSADSSSVTFSRLANLAAN